MTEEEDDSNYRPAERRGDRGEEGEARRGGGGRGGQVRGGGGETEGARGRRQKRNDRA